MFRENKYLLHREKMQQILYCMSQKSYFNRILTVCLGLFVSVEMMVMGISVAPSGLILISKEMLWDGLIDSGRRFGTSILTLSL